jgi:predicted dehydrogenase
MTRPIRVAVVGAGRMGGHHARVYSETTDCQLVAVVDKDPARAREAADKYGVEAFDSVAELTTDIDAASVAVPTVYHREVAVPLMERGVHVLVEKPLAPDAQAAKELVQAARKTRRVLQVGHSERFNPVVQALLRMNVSAKFIETHRISPFTFRSADVGVVFDMMIHDIDIVLHLVRNQQATKQSLTNGRREAPKSGEAAPFVNDDDEVAKGTQSTIGNRQSAIPDSYTIDAVGVNVLSAHEDVANARVRFANGAVANLTASRLALKTERKIRVFAPTAYLSMDYQQKSGIAIKVADNLDLIRLARERNFEDLSQMAHLDFGQMVKIEPLFVADVEPLRAEIESFLESARLGTSAAVSAEDGLAAVEMAERITRAVREQDWGRQLILHG